MIVEKSRLEKSEFQDDSSSDEEFSKSMYKTFASEGRSRMSDGRVMRSQLQGEQAPLPKEKVGMGEVSTTRKPSQRIMDKKFVS